MEPINKHFHREANWLGKTLAAGVLAITMIPGSALATATYDAGAFFQFTNITAPTGVDLIYAVDLSSVTSSLTGDGSANADAFPPFNQNLNLTLSDITPNEVRVDGSAAPAPGQTSFSDAAAASSVSVTAINTLTGGGNLDVVFEFMYGADVLTTATDLADVVGTSASILMDKIFGDGDGNGNGNGGGGGNPILDEALDLVTVGDNSLFNFGTYTLSLAPGEFNGVFVDLFAEGIAISTADEATPGVPVPTTLALFGIGLIGLAYRRRWSDSLRAE